MIIHSVSKLICKVFVWIYLLHSNKIVEQILSRELIEILGCVHRMIDISQPWERITRCAGSKSCDILYGVEYSQIQHAGPYTTNTVCHNMSKDPTSLFCNLSPKILILSPPRDISVINSDVGRVCGKTDSAHIVIFLFGTPIVRNQLRSPKKFVTFQLTQEFTFCVRRDISDR